MSDAGGPTLRVATPADVPALTDLFVRVRTENVPAIPPLVHPPETVGPFLATVLRTDRVWVAEDDTGVVGFLALGPGGEVDHLYVRGDRTGRGTGTALLARARGAHPEGLWLWTFASNTGARRFYARHGFVETGGTDGDNEERAPDVRLEWRPATDGPVSAGGSPR